MNISAYPNHSTHGPSEVFQISGVWSINWVLILDLLLDGQRAHQTLVWSMLGATLALVSNLGSPLLFAFK
jgi:hypothetical protein